MGINKVRYHGETLIDLTQDSVTPETLLKGETAHDKAGEIIVGTVEIKDMSDATVTADKIFAGETAYTSEGKITGTFTIENELTEQNDLIS